MVNLDYRNYDFYYYVLDEMTEQMLINLYVGRDEREIKMLVLSRSFIVDKIRV